MLKDQEHIQQALKLHKLINKSSTLATGQPKKPPSSSATKATAAKRIKKGSKDLTGSHHTHTHNTIEQSSHEVKHSSTEKSKTSPSKTFVGAVEKCEEHPGESLQFYSLAFNKALCPMCLLSGVYAGAETLSIKKAGETLKHKMMDLVVEMEGKLDAYELYTKKLANRKEELKDIASGYKKEVAGNIAQLIHKLQAKEKELIEQLSQTEKGKLEELNLATQKLKEQEDQVRTKKKDLERSVKELSGLNLCDYYSKQTPVIQSCLQDEGILLLQEAKIIAETNVSLQGKVSLDRFKEAIRNNNAEIDQMTTIDVEPLIEPIKSARLRSPPRSAYASDKENAFSHKKMKNVMSNDFHSSALRHEGLASSSKATRFELSSRDFNRTATKLGSKERKHGIDDILMDGYRRIQEMKAISPIYSLPGTTKGRRKEDAFGLSDLLTSSTASKRPQSNIATHESKLQTLFTESRFSGKENVESHKGTPHRGFDLERYTVKDKH